MRNKFFFQVLKRLFCYLLVSVGIGFVLMVLSYALPNEPIRNSIKGSMSMFNVDPENPFPQWANGLTATNLDYWTDAIILQEAAAEGDYPVVQKAMLNPYFDYYYGTIYPPQALQAYANDGVDMTSYLVPYGRYWHGYLVFLRPLLSIMTVGHIRVLNFTLQLILFMIICRLIREKLGETYQVPFFISWIVVNLISSGLSFQYTSMAYVTLLAMVYLLSNKDKIVNNPTARGGIYDMFFFVGIGTAFLDFLTYPLIGLGIPLCYYLVMKKDDFKNILKSIVLSSIVWVAGYGLMWASKWILATLITGNNFILNGISNVMNRTYAGTDSAHSSALHVIFVNIRDLGYKAFLIILLGVFAYYLYKIIKGKYCFRWNNVNWALLIIAAMPFVWITVIRNHSEIHTYMVHKIFAITVCACLCMISASLQSPLSKDK